MKTYGMVVFSTLMLAISAHTQPVAPFITNITVAGGTPQFGVYSDLGVSNQIQHCSNLCQANWQALTNLLVVQSPYWYVDAAAPPASQRFYRVAALPADSHARRPM